ncbi:MAG: flagellar protein export ATPase FliI [Dongiaceae bacterium]
MLSQMQGEVDQIDPIRYFGQVTGVLGMLVELTGVTNRLSVGDRCVVLGRNDKRVPCEVVGFRDNKALAMPFADLAGIGMGSTVEIANAAGQIYPTFGWLGRIINALGEPIDQLGPLPLGGQAWAVKGTPPPAHARQRVTGKIDLGVRSINTFTTCCRGQRLGIFSGSGVGKSTVISMMAKYTNADVTVIGLVGERGREVQEFVQDDLGPEGLKRAVLVVATSDESPLMRRQAAYMTLAVAEYFRDQGKNVLCLMDSVTRFAMAQREIGLSVGEPPTSKGYTPTVFTELPKLLERAGPGLKNSGSITALFSVLVEGDDTNEPISDAVRGILDGHIVLDRAIAERGRYPAINILRSLSRSLPDCNSPDENKLVSRARQLLASYEDMAEMIRLGAYRPGSDPKTDEAIKYYPALEDFLRQGEHEPSRFADGYAQLAKILQS